MKPKLRFVTAVRQRRMNFLPRKFCLEKLAGLFRPPGLLIIFLLQFSSITLAQEQTPPEEFPIGSGLSYEHRADQTYHQIFNQTGLNRKEQEARQSTSQFLTGYNVGAVNMKGIEDYIYHYSSSYYSKWEAEEDIDTPYIGAKHKYGKEAYWYDPELNKNVLCWSTEELTTAGDSLVFGPHYHQEKWYRRWLYNDPNMNGIYDVRYIPRYRMALNVTDTTLQPNEAICRLTVTVRYAPIINGNWNGLVYDDTLKETITLYASDFPENGEFDYFYFSDNPNERWYQYPEEFQNPGDYYKMQQDPPDDDTVWVDIYGNNGVEFRVEWLGNTKCDLYIDYIEVYDDFGWRDYIDQPFITTQNIIQYAEQYADSFSTWNVNLANWIGCDEPYTIDSYVPLRTVDSLLKEIGAPRLMIHFYPYWDIEINKDTQLVRYYNMSKPDILNIHFFPFNSWNPTPTFFEWDVFRKQLQISASLTGEKGFWYKAQNFGYKLDGGGWLTYRKPDSSEHKAEIMLALAHGIKGLFFSSFDSFRGFDDVTEQWFTHTGFIGLPEENYLLTDLYIMAINNIIPRLKGKLGKTLMKLDYTGIYLQLQHVFNQQNPNTVTYDYLTIDLVGLTGDHNWHCGFFSRQQHLLDNYFMLDNLITTNDRTIKVTIDPPFIEDYPNYRFRNVEGQFDTTMHSDNFTMQIDYEAGEGYLYQVAPVIKYGGRLLYSEATQPGMMLYDDMIIENGAVLTVNGVYSSKGNITVKSGGIINGSNGKIQFAEGKKLIIEGSGSITGTANSKLHLEFSEPVNDDPTGIMIKAGGSLTITSCKIENATIGINSLLNANYLNAHNIEFINCRDYSISIAGRSPGMNSTPPRRYLTA